MKKRYLLFIPFALLLISAAMIFNRIDLRKARSYNVCKTLNGDVLVYVIFVDTKTTAPWTEFDIETTRDSVAKAVQWLTDQAVKNGVELNIKTDMFVGQEFTTIKRDLPEGSVRQSFTSPNTVKGTENLNKWADYIAKKAGTDFNITDKDGLPEIKNPRNKERLIAWLRDEHKVESVALLLMVNNYFRDDISVQMNTMSCDDVEFAVVSYKYPSGIAHNILHLFGAADLHDSPFRKSDKNINFALQEFPNEVMQNPYAKNVSTLEINNFTKYLIGWCDTIDQRYEPLFIEKGIRL
ncbi:MAG: hypothetical protein KJ607_08655 [Bacteroidetes bacterium]|nr:hypothetical protein [Bacteroidota bacterium]